MCRRDRLSLTVWKRFRENTVVWYGVERGVAELGFLIFAYFSPTNLNERKRQEPHFSRYLSVALGFWPILRHRANISF